MNKEEYANLENIERSHWYYSGKREIVKGWIQRTRPPNSRDLLLDCGAGTGLFASEMESHCRVVVLDDHPESLVRLRTRFSPDQVITLVDGNIPLPNGSVQIITALDVLEHVPDDKAVSMSFHKLLSNDGIVVITVPASMALWSDWDVALHHYRRYNRSQLIDLFPSDSWDVIYVNYTNVFIFPLVWIVRKIRGFTSRFSSQKRLEDKTPPSWINTLLKKMFVLPAHWHIRFPFGVSLLLVARRR